MQFTVDGLPAFAATGGRAPKPGQPSVVFVHGAGMDHTVWTLQARWFAHHGRNVFALDLPGHGRSAGAAAGAIGAQAEWLLRFLDAAGLAQAALVGHSMGALVALAAAARAPQRVWALALLGAAPAMKVHPDLLAAARAGDHAAIDLVSSWGLGRRAHLGGAAPPGTWMLGGATRLLERDRAGALAADLAACDAWDGAPAAAAAVRCPTLLLAGTLDRMTPAKGARELAARIEGARFVELAGCGHMMMIERPDATLDALAEVV
jgi:pimeloyl-ACP methyl ester carboxylesterase